jgi:dolichyl-phosphate-mannose--protein O-mannosyl transferase
VNRSGLTRLDLSLMGLLTVAGGLIRGWHLTRPPSYFDEGIYGPDACWLLHRSASLCGQAHEIAPEHPPLGKWLIASGIEVLGFHSSGWRIASLIAGTLMIPMLYLLGRRLIGSTVGAAVASGLLAIDFLHFLHSRLAMLDIFVAFFVLAAVLCAVIDRDHLREGALRDGRLARPWRLAAGACAGAAIACKWSGLGALLAILILTVIWELARPDGRRSLRSQVGPIVGSLLVAPLAVYLASYIHVLHGTLLTEPWKGDFWFRAFLRRQHLMLTRQSGLTGSQPYESPPWSWPLIRRPVVYYFRTTPAGAYREVLGMGSPLVWWASIPAVGYGLWGWARRRDPWSAEAVIVTVTACLYLPWFIVAINREQLYLFYMLPIVPFMCLALAVVADRLWSRTAGRVAVAVFACAALALFGVYYPILAARPISPAQWRERIIFKGGCTSRLPALYDSGRPPPGFCWI